MTPDRTDRWVYEKIDRLSTPCGDILVTDEAGKRCRFSVRKNSYDVDCTIFEGTPREQRVDTDTNYEICIDTRRWGLGDRHCVRLVGGALAMGSTDERTFSVSGTINGFSLSIGAYDPNDDEKMDQWFAAPKWGRKPFEEFPYVKNRFREYELEILPDCSGFSFRLLEDSVTEVCFKVAWIENPGPDREEFRMEYESAVEFWTT